VLAGWVGGAIDPRMLAFDDNLLTLRARLDAPLLGVVPHLASPQAALAARHLDLGALRSTAALAA
jgi:dethiobiotin synthetase